MRPRPPAMWCGDNFPLLQGSYVQATLKSLAFPSSLFYVPLQNSAGACGLSHGFLHVSLSSAGKNKTCLQIMDGLWFFRQEQ